MQPVNSFKNLIRKNPHKLYLKKSDFLRHKFLSSKSKPFLLFLALLDFGGLLESDNDYLLAKPEVLINY